MLDRLSFLPSNLAWSGPDMALNTFAMVRRIRQGADAPTPRATTRLTFGLTRRYIPLSVNSEVRVPDFAGPWQACLLSILPAAGLTCC
jgi:hypothetical protein